MPRAPYSLWRQIPTGDELGSHSYAEICNAKLGVLHCFLTSRIAWHVFSYFCIGFLKQSNKTVFYGGNIGKRKRAQLQQHPRLPVPTLEGLVRRQGFIKHRIRELQSPCFKPQTRQVWDSVRGSAIQMLALYSFAPIQRNTPPQLAMATIMNSWGERKPTGTCWLKKWPGLPTTCMRSASGKRQRPNAYVCK